VALELVNGQIHPATEQVTEGSLDTLLLYQALKIPIGTPCQVQQVAIWTGGVLVDGAAHER
jgi:hypothetical protein